MGFREVFFPAPCIYRDICQYIDVYQHIPADIVDISTYIVIYRQYQHMSTYTGFYKLMAEYHVLEDEPLELAQDFWAIFSTKCVLEDETAWKEALSATCLFLALSENSPMSKDMMHRVLSHESVYKTFFLTILTKRVSASSSSRRALFETGDQIEKGTGEASAVGVGCRCRR